MSARKTKPPAPVTLSEGVAVACNLGVAICVPFLAPEHPVAWAIAALFALSVVPAAYSYLRNDKSK
jgi:hypothetical protein